jgi:NADPH:quinone reductase-like Zn-dependent oxidoreductase
MKAIIYREYGSPSDVLRFEDVQAPAVTDDGVLVRIRAAAVNPLDWHAITGMPYAARLGSGWRRPKVPKTPGVDFAGDVEAVGRAVQRFQPGDRVVGMRIGAFAEYICVSQNRALTVLPASLSYEAAATLPVAAGTALEGLRGKGNLKAGQRVLINGGSGGVGTFAVQIAKALGADVTGVCSPRNADLVKSLGADRVIDYTREDFTNAAQPYDLIFDIAGNRTWAQLKRVLTPHGTVVVVGGPKTNRLVGPLTHFVRLKLASVGSRRSAAPFIANVAATTLRDLGDLCESGQLNPAIDRRYPLSQTADAVTYVGGGHAPAKVVLTV